MNISKPASNGMVNCSGTLLYVFWQRPAHESANSYRSRWNTSSLDIWIYIRKVVNFGEYIYQSPLQNEALSWLNDKHQESGFIFLNKYGDRITTRGISGQLKKLAVRYGIDPAVVYPHSFRHRFAKSFLDRCNDIAFLADLMGHESIETTRIYLRKTSTEQRAIVDEVIDW